MDEKSIFREKMISALIGALFIAVFLPFGLESFGLWRWLLILGMFFIFAIACISSEIIVRYVFRMNINKNSSPKYLRRRGFIFQTINVALLTILLSLYLDRFANNVVVDNHLSWHNVLWVFAICLCVSFIIGLYWRSVYVRRYYYMQLEEAQLLNGMLAERARTTNNSKISTHDIAPTPIVLEGSTKESLTLYLDDFIYAESEGNYLAVYHISDGMVSKTVLRTSIKNAVNTLCNSDNVIQCHRAYIANTRMVEKVEGRSSGLALRMKYCQALVPVSKSYVTAVKELIKNPHI